MSTANNTMDVTVDCSCGCIVVFCAPLYMSSRYETICAKHTGDAEKVNRRMIVDLAKSEVNKVLWAKGLRSRR